MSKLLARRMSINRPAIIDLTMVDEMLSDNPIAMWLFDEASGTLYDTIGSLELNDIDNLSYSQDGPGSYSAIKATGAGVWRAKTSANNVSPNPTDGTWEIWLKQTTITTSATAQTPWSMFGNIGDVYGGPMIDNYGHLAQGVNGSLRFVIGREGTGSEYIQVAIDQLLVENVWTHLAWTFVSSTGTLKAYRNGVLDNTQVGVTGTRSTVQGPVRFGSFSSSYSLPWLGLIGPAAIYDTALSEERLLAHYEALT